MLVGTGVRNRTGAQIDSQRDVGGWPDLKSLPAPRDSDDDGMPDACGAHARLRSEGRRRERRPRGRWLQEPGTLAGRRGGEQS
ncbi:hypothetical protein E5A73_18770 [Sphingomonas gei]|uniref:Uncharacterized protein n=1 Tax=Sphingomonas gei TaxID=1395960 RepID=A0A4S1X7H1_9SPHN|nr:hypothetical protein E5A73_18770 [Sphingomonas gei]